MAAAVEVSAPGASGSRLLALLLLPTAVPAAGTAAPVDCGPAAALLPAPPWLAAANRDSCRADTGAPPLGEVAAELAAELAALEARDSRLLKRAIWPVLPPPAPAAAADGVPGWLELSARDMCCASLCAALPAGPRLFMRLSRPVMGAGKKGEEETGEAVAAVCGSK